MYRDTEGGHCQGACPPQWFFYAPLNVSNTAPPFTWSCEPREIHSLQCWRTRSKSAQASPAHHGDWTWGRRVTGEHHLRYYSLLSARHTSGFYFVLWQPALCGGQYLQQVWIHGHGLHQTSCGRLHRSHSRTRLRFAQNAVIISCSSLSLFPQSHSLCPLCRAPLILSSFNSWSTSLKSPRMKFFGKPETPCLGTLHSFRQVGHWTFCSGTDTRPSMHCLHSVCRHGNMRGSVKSPRQMGHSSLPSVGCASLEVMVVEDTVYLAWCKMGRMGCCSYQKYCLLGICSAAGCFALEIVFAFVNKAWT